MRKRSSKLRFSPKPGAKPRRKPKKNPYPAWLVGEKRMVSFLISVPFANPRTIIKEAKSSGKSALFRLVRKGRTACHVIALVERTGLDSFVLLKKAVAPYDVSKPEERILKFLATREFGLGWPAELVRMKTVGLEQLQKQYEEFQK